MHGIAILMFLLSRGEATYHFGTSDARTNITFTSKMEVANILGSTHKVSGNAVIDFTAGTGSCHLVVPVPSMSTGMDAQDRAMKGELWLNAREFATIEFKSEKATFKAPSTWEIAGTFTMRGISKPMTIAADVRAIPEAMAKKLGEGSWIRVRTQFKVKLSDHGIKIPEASIATVQDAWDISLEMFGTTAKPADAAKPAEGDSFANMVRPSPVSNEGLEGTLYRFGLKPQMSTLSAASEMEVESVLASTKSVGGWLGVDLEKGSGKVRLSVPVKSLRTGIEDRDKHLAGPMWLDADKFADLTFESTQATRKDAKSWSIEGNFTMHGVSRPVTLEVQMREIPLELVEKAKWGKQPGLGFTTRFPIKLSDFGVKIPEKALASVNDVWKLSIDLVALQEPR